MPPAGDAVLLSLFSSLPSLPKQPYLQYTAAMVVAAYAKWLAQSAQAGQQHLLTQLLQMLTKGEASFRSFDDPAGPVCGSSRHSLHRQGKLHELPQQLELRNLSLAVLLPHA